MYKIQIFILSTLILLIGTCSVIHKVNSNKEVLNNSDAPITEVVGSEVIDEPVIKDEPIEEIYEEISIQEVSRILEEQLETDKKLVTNNVIKKEIKEEVTIKPEVIEEPEVVEVKSNLVVSIEETVEILSLPTDQDVEEDDIGSTMSCPDEPEGVVVLGVSTLVGAFNDLDEGGTILYGLPAVSVAVIQLDGFGIGFNSSVGLGLQDTTSLIATGTIGLSYGLRLSESSLSFMGGMFGAYSYYEREDLTNYLSSLGLGGSISIVLPSRETNFHTISLSINSGVIGDPCGIIQVGYGVSL